MAPEEYGRPGFAPRLPPPRARKQPGDKAMTARTGGLPRFYGSCTALITPFKGGKVDEASFQKLCARQIENGTNALVPCGTTGESPTLSHDEHNRVVELCVEGARGKVPVIAGAGSNSTAEAIAMTRHAAKVGPDAVLSVAPYYNQPTHKRLSHPL